MEEKDTTIRKSLSKTLFDSDVLQIAKNIAEAGIDTAIEGEMLKGIPVLDTVQGLANVAGSIRDHLFARKLKKFLQNLNSIDPEEVDSFRNKFEQDKKTQDKASQLLLNIIDQTKNEERIDLISKLFIAFLVGKIDYDELSALLEPINSIKPGHITLLQEIQMNDGPLLVVDPKISLLALNEFAVPDYTPHSDGAGVRYVVTDLGSKFILALS